MPRFVPCQPEMTRRKSKCEECPYKDKKPSERSDDELAYAACTKPEDFDCHMEESYIMCRGQWEMYHAARKKGIEADEEAGDRIFGDIEEEK